MIKLILHTIDYAIVQRQYKSLLYLLMFGRKFTFKIRTSQYDPSYRRLGLGFAYGSKMVASKMLSPHSYSTSSTQYTPILHRLATIHNAADRRRTDRAMGKGRLCYSISGPIMIKLILHTIDYASSLHCTALPSDRPNSFQYKGLLFLLMFGHKFTFKISTSQYDPSHPRLGLLWGHKWWQSKC